MFRGGKKYACSRRRRRKKLKKAYKIRTETERSTERRCQREKKEEKHRSACMHARIERGPPTSGVRENNISRPIGKVNFSNLRLVQVM